MLEEEECRRRAQKCEVQALATTDDFARAAFLAMAVQWRALADNTQRHRMMTGTVRQPADS
jgi:hypothetical protein